MLRQRRAAAPCTVVIVDVVVVDVVVVVVVVAVQFGYYIYHEPNQAVADAVCCLLSSVLRRRMFSPEDNQAYRSHVFATFLGVMEVVWGCFRSGKTLFFLVAKHAERFLLFEAHSWLYFHKVAMYRFFTRLCKYGSFFYLFFFSSLGFLLLPRIFFVFVFFEVTCKPGRCFSAATEGNIDFDVTASFVASTHRNPLPRSITEHSTTS